MHVEYLVKRGDSMIRAVCKETFIWKVFRRRRRLCWRWEDEERGEEMILRSRRFGIEVDRVRLNGN